MIAYLEIRSQKSRGANANGFGGPDTYVAVQLVPSGQQRLQSLNRNTAKKRGITLLYCGDGYSKNKGPKSSLGQAIAKGQAIVDAMHDVGEM